MAKKMIKVTENWEKVKNVTVIIKKAYSDEIILEKTRSAISLFSGIEAKAKAEKNLYKKIEDCLNEHLAGYSNEEHSEAVYKMVKEVINKIPENSYHELYENLIEEAMDAYFDDYCFYEMDKEEVDELREEKEEDFRKENPEKDLKNFFYRECARNGLIFKQISLNKNIKEYKKYRSAIIAIAFE